MRLLFRESRKTPSSCESGYEPNQNLEVALTIYCVSSATTGIVQFTSNQDRAHSK